MTVLDTSAIIDFLSNGNIANQVEAALIDQTAVISAITVFELFNGVRSQKHITQREKFVSYCRVIALDNSIARLASRLYADTRLVGKTICNEDLIIAATALHTESNLLTLNRKDFSCVPGLKLV